MCVLRSHVDFFLSLFLSSFLLSDIDFALLFCRCECDMIKKFIRRAYSAYEYLYLYVRVVRR